MGGRGGKGGAAGTANTAESPAGNAVEMVVQAIRTTPNTSAHALGDARMISDIRDALAAQGMTDRTDQDAALVAANRARRILLEPFLGKWMMTPREHDAAVLLAGEVQDYAMIA